MKETVLALLAVFIGLSTCTAQKIEMEKHFGGYEFSQNGESLKMKELMKAVESNSTSFELVKKARTRKTWAWILGNSGSALVGFSIGHALAGGDEGWSIAGIGAGLIGVAIPLSISGNKKAIKGIKLYNSTLGPTTQSFQKPNIVIKANGDGIGFVVRF
ncbi:MAG: hypothetical protein WBM55_08210 [Muriicola sp.]